jgi:quinoprotein glucose dehydrogenase
MHRAMILATVFAAAALARGPAAEPAPPPADDAAARAALPEFQIIPAATAQELTPANGWPAPEEFRQWTRSLGGPTSNRFSLEAQITPANVQALQVAWTWHAGDGRDNIQCNPIVVAGTLYTPTPGRQLAAIDAATGRERWKADLGLAGCSPFDAPARRGLLYWPGDGAAAPRLLFPGGRRVIALDPATGRRIAGFGDDGSVALPTGGSAGGAVWKRVLVMPGFDRDVFGFDVVTGRQLWRFATVAPAGAPGGDTWKGGRPGNAANCWGGIALDESRGIVYVATGSPKPNFIGVDHLGDGLFCNCIVALEAGTGAYLWHFQEIRHDIWDLDIPAPPNLVTVVHDGRRVDAVAQVTKLGNTLLLDRVTGKPLFPVRLRRATASTLRGEATAPYQPALDLPEPFVRQIFTPADVTDRTPAAHAFIAQLVGRADHGWFAPFAEGRPTAYFGVHGGAEWTGAACDPLHGRLYVSANEIPWIITVFRDDDPAPLRPAGAGELLYLQSCAACHGADRTGNGVAPPLRGLRHRLDDAAVQALWRTGRGLMPAQPQLDAQQQHQLLDFLFARDRGAAAPASSGPPRYAADGYHKLLDQQGYPGCTPPWGTLTCLDLNTGRRVWSVPLGEYPELTAAGVPRTGTENFGGAMITAGGLVFCSGTRDGRIRAFAAADGAELWSATLPWMGSAPPISYAIAGRQFVVVPATGGGKLGGPSGDAWVAFALPQPGP